MGADAPKDSTEAPAPGLVRSETSVTEAVSTPFVPCSDGSFYVDQGLSRLQRMRSNVITTARLHQDELQTGGFRFRAAMVTLTYRDDVQWSRRHVTRFIAAAREYFRRRCPGWRFRYVWVLELTKRGRPHYHVLIWLPRGVTLPKPDKRGWWPHGFTRIEWARRPVGYLAKYASKASDLLSMPKGARLYGVGGLSLEGSLERAWWNLPAAFRAWGLPADRVRRCVGGGWLKRATGEWWPPLWGVRLWCGGVFIHRLDREAPPRLVTPDASATA